MRAPTRLLSVWTPFHQLLIALKNSGTYIVQPGAICHESRPAGHQPVHHSESVVVKMHDSRTRTLFQEGCYPLGKQRQIESCSLQTHPQEGKQRKIESCSLHTRLQEVPSKKVNQLLLLPMFFSLCYLDKNNI